jgi:hypothetical protein
MTPSSLRVRRRKTSMSKANECGLLISHGGSTCNIVAKLEAQLGKARDIIEWYADESNYGDLGYGAGRYVNHGAEQDEWEPDQGKIARDWLDAHPAPGKEKP